MNRKIIRLIFRHLHLSGFLLLSKKRPNITDATEPNKTALQNCKSFMIFYPIEFYIMKILTKVA
jgi:hypothetical protein